LHRQTHRLTDTGTDDAKHNTRFAQTRFLCDRLTADCLLTLCSQPRFNQLETNRLL